MPHGNSSWTTGSCRSTPIGEGSKFGDLIALGILATLRHVADLYIAGGVRHGREARLFGSEFGIRDVNIRVTIEPP